jgi:hypothetical protein
LVTDERRPGDGALQRADAQLAMVQAERVGLEPGANTGSDVARTCSGACGESLSRRLLLPRPAHQISSTRPEPPQRQQLEAQIAELKRSRRRARRAAGALVALRQS